MSAPCPTLGFHLTITFAADASADRRAALRAAFGAMIASSGLLCETSGDRSVACTVTGDGTQATESDREHLAAWLRAQPGIGDLKIGPLTDVADRV
jgi:uncharacterized protein YggL (DUF469 family)